MANLALRTLNEYDTFDPVRNLWRNVLVVAIEDAIKIKTMTLKFKHFYAKQNRRWHELDYVSLPNQDFDSVCYLANLDGNLVRRKVNETLERMEKTYGKEDMPDMPWKRLYNSSVINKNYTTVRKM
jgi:hypothetical protein